MAMQVKVLDASTASLTKHAGGVSIVHHQHCPIPFGNAYDFRQGCNVSIHTEYTIGDDKALAVIPRFPQMLLERTDVRMSINSLVRTGHANTVNDAGVVESSLMTRSPGPINAATVPTFAVYPDGISKAASAPFSSASLASHSS